MVRMAGADVPIGDHDLLPREPRPGQARAQRRLYGRVDAVVVHSNYGRRQLVERLGVDSAKVHVIPHGAFDYLTALAGLLAEDAARARLAAAAQRAAAGSFSWDAVAASSLALYRRLLG